MPAAHLILNRASGGNQRGLEADEVCREVEQAFQAQGKQIETTIVEPQDIEATLKKLIAQKPDQIIVGGGDGTVATAAGLLGGTGIALGVLPMGTFNLAARDIGVPLEIPAAAEFLATAPITEIDVLDVSGHACLCTLVLGFYPEFSETLERRDHEGKWWRKTLKLITGLPDFFKRARTLDLHWKTPTESGRVRTKFSAFVPGRYREAIGMVPAREGFQTGLLTAYFGEHRKASEAMKAAVAFIAGRHESNESLTVVEGKSMELNIAGRRDCKVMLDGEILTLPLPIQLRIIPRHLRVLADPGVVEKS